MNAKQIRALGATTAVGGVVWGLTWVISPSTATTNSRTELVGSLFFHIGLLAVLAVMWRTWATGTSRVARAAVAAELTAVCLAIGWTVAYIADPGRSPGVLLQVLDVFWP